MSRHPYKSHLVAVDPFAAKSGSSFVPHKSGVNIAVAVTLLNNSVLMRFEKDMGFSRIASISPL